MNHECEAGFCNPEALKHVNADGKMRRFFNTTDPNVDVARITELAGEDAVMLTPFDIDENGIMDILV